MQLDDKYMDETGSFRFGSDKSRRSITRKVLIRRRDGHCEMGGEITEVKK
jgi:hypothetical protein